MTQPLLLSDWPNAARNQRHLRVVHVRSYNPAAPRPAPFVQRRRQQQQQGGGGGAAAAVQRRRRRREERLERFLHASYVCHA